MHAIINQAVVAFRCIGDACPNTCCQGWNMQVDAATVAQYQHIPELLDIVEPVSHLGDVDYVMRRDATTDQCMQYDKGWCGVHAKYGDALLGDACNFFPRIVRQVQQTPVVTASLSCPEFARIALVSSADIGAFDASDIARVPTTMRTLATELNTDDAQALHQMFVAHVAENATPAQALLSLYSAAQSLEAFGVVQWPNMAPMAVKFAASRIPQADIQPADALNVVLAYAGLLEAANKHTHPNHKQRAEAMAELLGAPLSWLPAALATEETTLARMAAVQLRAETYADWLHPMLLRWVQAQLSAALFPFAGFGSSLSNRIAIIAVRLATLQLAVLARASHQHEQLTPADVVDEAHWLARFMDHLAEPELSERIYTETGWLRAARLRGLLEAVGL